MQTREFTINSVTDPELAAALAEAKQREEEANLRLAKLAAERAELEAATQKAEAVAEPRLAAEETERLRLEAEAEEQRRAEAEARKAAAQSVADAERAAELAEAKRKEEEENLQAAKLAAERAEAEAVAQKAEAEAARLRRVAEEEEEQRRVEAEARRIAAQNVADAERAAELAEAKRKEEEENLQIAKLAAERAEAEAATRKAEAEAEAAKAHKAEEQLKQEKVQIAAEKVQKASEKAADKEKQKAAVKEKKKLAKKRKKKYRSYRDFSVVKLILWTVGILALVVVLYVFATPISKGFFAGKNVVDTFLAEKLPKVAEVLKIKGNGYDMPIFKADSVYLKEDAEDYVQTAIWPRGYTASVVRLNGTQYICVEGNGLKMYYLNEIAENDTKHVYLEKGDAKALYYKEYSFENPQSLCPVKGTFNDVGVEQYIFSATDVTDIQILDGETLAECRVMLNAEEMAEIFQVSDYLTEDQNIRINMTVEEIPYSFAVMKKGGLSVPDGYKLTLEDVRYQTEENGIRFEGYVKSAGLYLGEMRGTLDYVAGGYMPAEVTFYAYGDEEYAENVDNPVFTATHYRGAQEERYEVTGANGERILLPVGVEISAE